MKTDIVFANGGLERIERHARKLINRTLAPLNSAIEIVAVKIDHDMAIPSASFDFHCTILLKIEGGATIRGEGRDCDDILAIYRAIAKIIDQIQLTDVKVGSDLTGTVE